MEDYLRALGYLNISVWAAVFFFFPPSVFVSDLAYVSRLLWLSVTCIGGLMALTGALIRIDLKLEFPGILLAMVGPIFYTLSQLYLSFFPSLADGGSGQRIALVVYALLGVTLMLPRALSLLVEKNRLKDLTP
jgi:hypothetical protein